MILTHLENIALFLASEVAESMRLKKLNQKDITQFELVHPQVHVGWIPPKDIDAVPPVPCLVVGLRRPVIDDGEQSLLSVQITALVYSQGINNPDGTFEHWFGGYADMFNLIERVAAAIAKADNIAGLSLRGEIECGPDEQQVLDFWVGRVNCTFVASALPRTGQNKQLL